MIGVEQTSAGVGALPFQDKQVNFTYNAASQFVFIDRYANGDTNQLVASSGYNYDGAGRLTGLAHSQGGTPLAGYAWTIDAVGRITSETNVDGVSDYSYDNTSQLVGADYDFQTDENYSYDANGNRIMSGYTIGANNRVLSDGTHDYQYDAEGNMTRRTEIATGAYESYEWDHHNRLTRIVTKDGAGLTTKEVEYTYDVFGQRLIKSIDNNGNGTVDQTHKYINDGLRPERGNAGDHIVLAFDGNNTLTNRYLYGPLVDQILADEQVNLIAGTSTVLWPLTDHLGSVRDLVSYNPAIGTTTNEQHIVYDAFGNVISTTTGVVHIFGFTAREIDVESDEQYNRGRYYDVWIAAWISIDPMGFAAGDPNLYRYVGNDSVNVTDPSGLAPPFNPGPIGNPANLAATAELEKLRDQSKDLAKKNLKSLDAAIKKNRLDDEIAAAERKIQALAKELEKERKAIEEFAKKCKGLSNNEISKAIGKERHAVINKWWGKGTEDAKTLLKDFEAGKPLPERLDPDALRAYRELYRRILTRETTQGDPLGTVRARWDLLHAVLKKCGY